MSAVAINVHLDVWDAIPEHGGEIFVGPKGMHPVAGSGAHDERRRRISWHGWVGIAGKGRRSRIDDSDEVRPRRECRQRIVRVAVLRFELLEEDRCWRRQLCPGGE